MRTELGQERNFASRRWWFGRAGTGHSQVWLDHGCPSWSWVMIMVRNFGGQPSFFRICHRPSLLTMSNALVKSTKVMYRPLFCSRHFSWSCLKTNTMSVVPRFALKPHWLSGRWSSAMVGVSLLSRIRARIFPAMESRVMPLWLEQSAFSPLFLYILYRVIMIALRRSGGSVSCSQQLMKNSWSLEWREGPPLIQTSGGMPSAPGALPDFSNLMICVVSRSVGGSSSSFFTGSCGIESISASWTMCLALKRLWKCSDQRSRMESLSVSKTFPSELRRGLNVWGRMVHRLLSRLDRTSHISRCRHMSGFSLQGWSTTCFGFPGACTAAYCKWGGRLPSSENRKGGPKCFRRWVSWVVITLKFELHVMLELCLACACVEFTYTQFPLRSIYLFRLRLETDVELTADEAMICLAFCTWHHPGVTHVLQVTLSHNYVVD